MEMKESLKTKTMVITLGGSPEPLKKSISWSQPEFVEFTNIFDFPVLP